MQTPLVKIGTRGSALALYQARETRARLMAAHGLGENNFEIVVISTAGDRIQNRPLSEVGGKGLFTKEIEEALLDKRIDLAVHSSKDMPTVLPEGLELSAFLEREDPRDAFVGHEAGRFEDLPQGAVIGSSSLRRQALIARLRPDIKCVMFRGNVPTRLQKVEAGEVTGTLLALAGLRRLELDKKVTQILDLERFPPAPGQGAIGIESRVGDTRISSLLAPINHPGTKTALTCERAFLGVLDGSCRTPIAGLATIDAGKIGFYGLVLTPDGTRAHEIHRSGSATDAPEVGREAGAAIKAAAGADFFAEWA